MVLLELDATAAETLIADYPGVTVTVYSSPRQTVVAGPTDAVDAVIAAAREQNTFARRVNMEVASHTAMMDPILGELSGALAGLAPRVPRIPVISTVENADAATLFDAGHWVANVRNPVRFSQAVAAAGAEHCTFIEISPHPVLTKAISETLASVEAGAAHHHTLGTLQRDTHDTLAFHTNLNATHTAAPPHARASAGAAPRHSRPRPGATPGTGSTSHRRCPATDSTCPPGARAPAGENSPIPPDWLYEPAWPIKAASRERDREPGAMAGRRRRRAGRRARPRIGPVTLGRRVDNVLFAPPALSDSIDVAAAYALFSEAKKLVEELLSHARAAAAVHRDAQRPARHRRRSRQPGACRAVGPGPHPRAGDSRNLGRHHRCRRLDAGGVDRAAGARRSRKPATARTRSCTASGARHVPRLRRTPVPAPTVALDRDTSHLVIGATGHIGPHLIQQLADMGAGTIVAVSRNPGGRLDELAQRTVVERNDAGLGGRRRHRRRPRWRRCSTGSAPNSLRSKASTWRPSPAGRWRWPT